MTNQNQSNPEDVARSLMSQGAVPIGKAKLVGQTEPRKQPLAYRTSIRQDDEGIKLVFIEFNQPTEMLGITPDKARKLALELRQLANKIDPHKKQKAKK